MTTISSNNMNVEGPKEPLGGVVGKALPTSKGPAKPLPDSSVGAKATVARPDKNSTLEKLANVNATAALKGSTTILRKPVAAQPKVGESDPKPVQLKGPRMLTSNADPKPVELKSPRMLTSTGPKELSGKELNEIGEKMEYADVEETAEADSMKELTDFASSMPFADEEEEVESDPKKVELKSPRMLTSTGPKELSDKDLNEIGDAMEYADVEETTESTIKDAAWDDASKLRPLPPNPMGRSSDATINKMYESVQRQLDEMKNLQDVAKQIESKLHIKIDLVEKRAMAEQGKLGAWTVEKFDHFITAVKEDLANNLVKDYGEILTYMNQFKM